MMTRGGSLAVLLRSLTLVTVIAATLSAPGCTQKKSGQITSVLVSKPCHDAVPISSHPPLDDRTSRHGAEIPHELVGPLDGS